MGRIVIPLESRRRRRAGWHDPQVVGHGEREDSNWTREELRAWDVMSQKRHPGPWFWFGLLGSLAVHVAMAALFFSLKRPVLIDLAPPGTQTRVSLVSGSEKTTREKGEPEPQTYPNKPADAPIITGPSTSAARRPQAAQRPEPRREPDVLTRASPERQVPPRDPASQVFVPQNAAPRPETPEVQPAGSQTGVGFSPKLKDLLPNSRSEFVASQRRIGTVYGRGAVGGDLDPEADGRDPVGYRAPLKGEVKLTRYDYAAYFLALDQRFTDAWGATRVLPPGSTFNGVVGEFIEYDIVINRNGSLSKIINVSKGKQPNRDYGDVDRLVNEVFSHVFPLNPVPSRIQEDPLILRKRIRFTGYQYYMF